ncbi:geranylgeranyl reductase family protein [candidate division KSB1 bacterium]
MQIDERIFRETYDVIVVGGGPAGCLAAYYAAVNGAKTIVFERDPVIGVPVRCGEGVSERGIKEYVSMTGPWIVNKVSDVEFVAPDGEKILIKTDMVSYILDRTKFDKHLSEKAEHAGAVIVTETDVTGLFRKHDTPAGVTVQYRGKEYKVSGKVIIGADGVESRVGRWAGINTVTKLRNMESSIQVVVSDYTFEPSKIILYFSRQVAPGGYAWVFPKNSEKANVGLGIAGTYAHERSAEEYLDQFLKAHFPGAVYTQKTAGGVPCNPPLKNMVRDNVLLAGDAGHTVNSMSGAGIANALQSGQFAGEAAAKACADMKNFNSILQSYPKTWFRGRGRDLKKFDRLKNYVQNLDDDQLNELTRLLHNIPQSEWSILKIFMFALRNKPDLILDAIKLYRNF